ncbi:DUF547 domain-containing protein [Marixanthomonas ophiurae]|uniref:DUF547 domain-containing protein n=1 Tax=Marixanthomonas ophiurae TaxID=387659 RepID=A0A3E1Q9S0_9FLAO|nr:DUF547 domain-containing protein [Marixanthomonas ophiurae]RFN58876.1 DUF547 domain-containing protein [Marixanthomonas ophiurae]
MKHFLFLIATILFFNISSGFSQSTDTFLNDADIFFKTYISNGKVDYKSVEKNPEKLNRLLDQAANISVSISEEKTYQAFWINAYNLAVIKGIIDNYPIDSPLDKGGFFESIKYNLGGTSLTLNDIENKKLRAQFDEPRFHFVLVCGAKGCPPIIAEAYKPSTLEKQLQEQTVKALNNPLFIKVSENEVSISEIFKWYKEDFEKNGQSELDFINQFRKEKIIPSNFKVSYYPYNWQLNQK